MRYTKFELKALKNAIKRQVGKARYSHREVLLAPISCIENPFTVRLISRSHREEVVKQESIVTSLKRKRNLGLPDLVSRDLVLSTGVTLIQDFERIPKQ